VHTPPRFRPLSGEHETWMWMSGLIALCGLAVVALLVLPFLGPRVAAMTAVIVVVAIVFVCYLVCLPRAFARATFHGAQGGRERDH